LDTYEVFEQMHYVCFTMSSSMIPSIPTRNAPLEAARHSGSMRLRVNSEAPTIMTAIRHNTTELHTLEPRSA
jgi:hypothetical protein